MKILVVEDEVKLAGYLQQGLQRAGHAVVVENSGTDGLHRAMEERFDVIILDRMLPGIGGIPFLAALRAEHQTPVLMLSARGEVGDRIEGLQAGADDYLAKPFSFAELLARVETLARRAVAPAKNSALVRVGPLVIDQVTHTVTRSGQRIELTNKEFNLLCLLAASPGKVFSKTLIASEVWDVNFDTGTNTIEVAVARLRAKIDGPFDDALLHTVRGAGYKIEASDGPFVK
jgi:heavy metal response regulator